VKESVVVGIDETISTLFLCHRIVFAYEIDKKINSNYIEKFVELLFHWQDSRCHGKYVNKV